MKFSEKIISIVNQIPKGEVLTYREVARKAGNEKAARAVGRVLNTHDPQKQEIPCHRVIKSNGQLGGYRWGKEKKLKKLKDEGVIF